MLSPKEIKEIVKSKSEYLSHQHVLIDIFEGNLSRYVDADLKNQLSHQSYEQARHRMAPINILPKVIDKLTHIYQTPVLRTVEGGNDTDKALVDWYVYNMGLNQKMNSANELYNLCRSTLLYPFVDKGVPQVRVVLNDRFVVYSDDPIQPEKPTHVILLAGSEGPKQIYWTWSADNFVITDSDERLRLDLMNLYENPDGINPIGRLPFVYVNASDHRLCPIIETDTLSIVKLLPVMLSDLNLAAMFQSFSIMYGIDVNDENIKFAPNAFWRLKSDPSSDKKPEIGQIKPQVDFDQVLKLIESELSMWLGTKGIRAGAVGQLSPESFSSGISKIIDEMDTYEAREKQVTEFKETEAEFWDLLLNDLHPYWSETGQIDNNSRFTPTALVITDFVKQLPQQARGQVVRDIKEEYMAGFISRKRAIKALNSEMSDGQVDDLILEIDQERNGIEESISYSEEQQFAG